MGGIKQNIIVKNFREAFAIIPTDNKMEKSLIYFYSEFDYGT